MSMYAPQRALWHISPKYNLDSILIYGVEPSRAKGNFNRVWLCEWRGVVNALAHISARHSIPVDKLVAIKLLVRPEEVTHFRLSMWVSYVTQKKIVRVIDGAHALSNWEAQRKYRAKL